MLRIKVELVPFGDETHAREIGEMVIANDGSGDPEYGNYVAWFGSDTWTGRKAEFVRLIDFPRKEGVWELVRRLVERYQVKHKYIPDYEPESLCQKLKKRLGRKKQGTWKDIERSLNSIHDALTSSYRSDSEARECALRRLQRERDFLKNIF